MNMNVNSYVRGVAKGRDKHGPKLHSASKLHEEQNLKSLVVY